MELAAQLPETNLAEKFPFKTIILFFKPTIYKDTRQRKSITKN